MTFLPIVSRELRVAARQRGTYAVRIRSAVLPILVASLWLPVFASQFTASQGRVLFSVLSSLAFAYCMLAGVMLTSDCISSEKRDGTIGLLFLTPLRGYDVILGKLVSRSLTAFYGLLAIVPVLSMALLFGGVTLDEVGRTTLLFLNTLFLSLSAGLFASTLSRHQRRAMFAASCILLFTAAVPYGVALLLSSPGSGGFLPRETLLAISPIFAFRVLGSRYAGPLFARDFYVSLGATHVLSWGILFCAAAVLPRLCRERPPGRVGLQWMRLRNRWSYGPPAKRSSFRKRLLDRNAFYWLAARDCIKAQYVWFFTGAMTLIWLCVGWFTESFVFDWDVSLWLLFFLFVFLKVWLASEVCSRLTEDRASGAFELLLSSPLQLKDLVRGQSLALWRQFGKPTLALLLVTYWLMLSALRSAHYSLSPGEIKLLFWSLMLMLVADMATLKWVGMWQAAINPQLNRALLASCNRVLVLPTLIFIVSYSVFWLLVSPTRGSSSADGRWYSFATWWLVIGLTNDATFYLRSRWLFLNRFRELASQHFVLSPNAYPSLVLVLTNAIGKLQRTETKPKQIPVSWWRWALAGTITLFALAFLALLIRMQAVDRQLEAKLAAIAKTGEPLTMTEFEQWRSFVPEDENAALLYQRAAALLVPPRRPPRGVPGPKRLDWPGPVAPLTRELRPMADYLVANNRRALEILDSAARLSKSRYPLDWKKYPVPSMAQWQAIVPLQPAKDLLQFTVLLRLESSDVAGAIRGVESLLALARAMGQEPLLGTQRMRAQYLNAALQALERILNHQALSRAELKRLAKSLQEAETATVPALLRALVGQRCLELEEMRIQERQPPGLGFGPVSPAQQLRLTAVHATLRLFAIPQNRELTYLKLLEGYRARLLAGTNTVEALANFGFPALFNGAHSKPHLLRAQEWEPFLWDQLQLIVRLRLTQAALKVELFQAEHQGRLPDTSEELLSERMRALPSDPWRPGPLHFRREQTGYVIYSVGADHQDNGGREVARGAMLAGTDIAFRVRRKE